MSNMFVLVVFFSIWFSYFSFVCSFSALTLLVGSFDPYKPFPDMTYNVFGGTLSLTQSINQSIIHAHWHIKAQIVIH